MTLERWMGGKSIQKDFSETFVVDQTGKDDVKRRGVFSSIPMQISKISAWNKITFDPINVE